MDDMNDSGSCTEGSRFYKQLRVVDDTNDFGSLAHDLRCYLQLKVMVDMNDLVSHELRKLNAMNNLDLWMI